MTGTVKYMWLGRVWCTIAKFYMHLHLWSSTLIGMAFRLLACLQHSSANWVLVALPVATDKPVGHWPASSAARIQSKLGSHCSHQSSQHALSRPHSAQILPASILMQGPEAIEQVMGPGSRHKILNLSSQWIYHHKWPAPMALEHCNWPFKSVTSTFQVMLVIKVLNSEWGWSRVAWL